MLNVTLAVTGALSIAVDTTPWLTSGAVVARDHAQWYASDCGALVTNKCTPLHAASALATATGVDAVGAYTETMLSWTPSQDASRSRDANVPDIHTSRSVRNTNGAVAAAPLIITGVRRYAARENAVVLTQHFPRGLVPQNSHGETTEIVSAFPTFSEVHRDLGVVDYEGVQLQSSRYHLWRAGTAFGADDPGPENKAKTSPDGAYLPLVLTSGSATLVASPLDDFFTACQTPSLQTSNFSFGLQGTLEAVPPGHVHATLMLAGSGPRATLRAWGDVMLESAGGGKQRSMNWTHAGDPSLRSLSYYTDNGAYYYYNTANGSCSDTDSACCANGCKTKKLPTTPLDGTGYQATLRNLTAAFKTEGLPIRAVQYDSWWYYKGDGAGVVLWEPMPSTLGGPDVNGDPSTWFKLPLPTITHCRFFQSDNDYLTGKAPGLNGKTFSWVVGGKVAVSNDTEFFVHIFSRAKAGLGMVTFEQDFLTAQYEGCAPLQQQPGLAKQWLAAMAEAAEQTNITVQYCMALPRMILQSASFPRVTHARASHDYGQSRATDTQQWSSIGLTSLLYWSLGVIPFKDDFWSETVEPGNTWKSTEADPELQTLVSALLGGPVGPADAIGSMNTTRILQTSQADGTLLKPLYPAGNLESTFSQIFAGPAPNPLGIPHVWGTALGVQDSSGHSLPTHRAIFAANLTADGYIVTAAEAQSLVDDDWSNATFVAREYYSGTLSVISGDAPLRLPEQPRPDRCSGGGYTSDYCIGFGLWTLAAMPNSGGLVLVGELNKFIAVSPQRFSELVSTLTGLSVRVTGSAGEVLRIGVASCDGSPLQCTLNEVQCTLPETATAIFSCSTAADSCKCGSGK